MKLYSAHPTASITMGNDNALSHALRAAVAEYGIEMAVETGTYLGLGSTQMIIKALEGVPGHFLYTIESDPISFIQAQKNLMPYPWVRPILGLSVSRDAALKFIDEDPILAHHQSVPDIFIDDTTNPKLFYKNEIEGKLTSPKGAPTSEDNFLSTLLPPPEGSTPLILLDSAGGIGFLEFETVLGLMKDRDFVLALDDCKHLKHFRSHKFITASIKKGKSKWKIIDHDKTEGRWIVAYYNGKSS